MPDVLSVSTEAAANPCLTREELYALVWDNPMSHLAKRFGVSDQGLAKICDRFSIPRPKQGHWNKLAAGKPVETRPLPPPTAGLSETIRIARTSVASSRRPEIERALDVARSKTKTLDVGERLSRPHSIIAGWSVRRESELKKREPIYDPRLRRMAPPAPFSPQERRRHRILDALFKALETHGVTVTEGERRDLLVTSGCEKIEFQLRSKLRQVQRPLTADERRWRFSGDKDYRLELEETGILIFEVKSWLPGGLQRSWQDGRKGTIETMAGDILTTLLASFPLMATEREKRADAERLREMEERRRQELQQQRKRERDRFRRLLEHAGRWRDAELARAFVAALRDATADATALVDGRPATEWLAWAETYADRHDPLRSDPLGIFASIAEVTSWTYRD